MPVDRNRIQQQADKLVASGKVEAGIAQYQLLVNDNPRDLGTLNKIGDLYVRLNRRAEAIRAFGRIAEIYAEDGFFLKAIAIYKKITKIDPAHLDTLQRLADLYSKQGLKTEARAQYAAVAEAYLKTGQQQKAIGVYEALAGLDPDNTQTRLAVAELKAKSGMSAEAARTYLDLARDLDRKGMPHDSARVYEMALGTGRTDPAVAEGLCAALAASGQHEKAAALAEEILRERPGNAAVLEARGMALAALGRGGEAEEALRIALDRDPRRVGAILALARLLAHRGALAEAHQAVASGLDDIVAADRAPEAVKILEEILQPSPSNRPALEDLYRLRSMLADRTGTISAGERLIAVCVEEGRHSEALAVARRLVELDPSNTARRRSLSEVQQLAEGRAAPPAQPEIARPEAFQPDPGEIGFEAETVPPPAEEAPAAEALAEAPVEEGAAALAGDAGVEPDLGEAPAALAGEPGAEPTLTPEDEEFIAEQLTEAEVFVKYGLADRAVEVLGEILERFPWHLPVRQRLRDVHLEEGNRERAAHEAAAMGRVLLGRGDREGAVAAVREARSIDASSPTIIEVEALLGEAVGGEAPEWAAMPRAAEVEPDVADIVIEEEEAAIEEGVEAPAAPPGLPAEDLEEFDFYLGQGMGAEAAAVLSRLETRFGPHPEIESRRAALGEAVFAGAGQGPEEIEIVAGEEPGEIAAGAGMAAVPEAMAEEIPSGPAEEIPEPLGEEIPSGPAEEIPDALVEEAPAEPIAAGAAAVSPRGAPPGEFFDLAAELDPGLFTAQEAAEEEALTALETTPEGHSLDEIVSAFKKGIEQQVDAEDFETHYNLGIAYKEMGLNEEAIAEFQFASKDPHLLADCCSMLGICFREKGMLSLAVKWYRKGLDALAADGDEERLSGVRYDLADVLEQMGEYRHALDLFLEVYGTDSRYRDVGQRVKDLQKRSKP